jgi:ribonuclease P protein component
MFKKNQRLGRTLFASYFKSGRRFNCEYFTLVHTPLVPFAVSVVVGKKVFKLANDRNTLRRRVYASARGVTLSRTISSGTYIIIAKPTAKTLHRKDVIIEIDNLLAQTTKSR